jgi:hypothetical protein
VCQIIRLEGHKAAVSLDTFYREMRRSQKPRPSR